MTITIAPQAHVHPLSRVSGEVHIAQDAVLAPGVVIHSQAGTPFYIGGGARLQEGTIVGGIAQGRVLGKDGKEYGVWIGAKTVLTHFCLVYGPCFIGENCFIGFRSTIFNSRIGDGCIVMMHAVIQDVEIPPGKYIASGSVITTQQQADHLPDITPTDRLLAEQLGGIAMPRVTTQPSIVTNGQQESTDMKEGIELAPLVRQLLAQGHRVGAEYADTRRFRTSSWQSCANIHATDEYTVLRNLQACLKEHEGEYVRLVGIDPKSRQRVMEQIIQRPGETPIVVPTANPSGTTTAKVSAAPPVTPQNGNAPDWTTQVRQLLAQGYRIGTEHADERRFRTSSWHSCKPIEATSESGVIAALNACLAEHAGEYVRLFGIDPKNKKRVGEMIIQRPGQVATAPVNTATTTQGAASPTVQLNPDADLATHVRSLLSQGYRIGTEHADERRFRTSSWHSCKPIEATSESAVMAALNACLAEHAGEYVRMFGIDPKNKKRVGEVIIQRPNGKAPGQTAPVSNATVATASPSYNNLPPEVVQHIRQILSQGYKVSAEYADERRFRTSSWQSCPPIPGNTEGEVVRALEQLLREHAGDYVRLIGMDGKTKRRVLETIVQRPKR
ncbi:MAG: ribulose bisphosphate carboxylase small subunit [Pseudanabaenaceae cyanobacterium SKYGB_i_bin29]|nr:ribulose bisphosphate carboxylase small subunit [Pseudanabaenaceae cyanobacterium SKYG29]MDW8421229.1 ribulose bisphosphate carboxylase small subunit [Pseudanabaenaceae cyanobacterium SKYGB_i_bin29]